MKKIIAVCIVITLICTGYFSADAKSDEAFSHYGAFLQMLAIEAEIADSQSVTRAEFAHLITLAINLGASDFKDGIFSDVNAETKYASSITKAYDMGIISGSGDGTFAPDAPITANAAIKMAVSALGYETIVQTYGGYPTGYHRFASEIGMTDGLSIFGDNPLSASEVEILLYNFLTSSLYIPDTVYTDGIIYNKNTDRTPLSVYFNLRHIEGIAETAGYETMLPSTDCTEPIFTIDGKSYKTTVAGAESYLGMNLSAWYDKDSLIIKAVLPIGTNNVHTVDSHDIVGFESDKLTVYNEESGKEKHFSVLPTAVFVKNGRPIVHSDSDFLINSGTLRLTDNNGDGRVDVILADVCEYMSVKTVDEENGIIYTDSQTLGSLNVKSEDSYFCHIDDAEGNELSVSSLKSENIISVFRSDNGKYCEIKVSDASVKGKIEEIGDGYLIIDSKKYRYNSHFDGISSVKSGGVYTFLLAHDGTITAFASGSKDDMKYGYVLDFASDTSSLESKVMLSVLTETGKYIYPHLSENVIFNSVSTKKEDSAIKSAFVTPSGDFIYQVIRYSLNSNSQIDKIDTALVHPSGTSPEVALMGQRVGDDKLTKFLSYHNSYWYNGYNAFAPNTLVGKDTLIFSVPYALGEAPYNKYESADFSVITTSELASWGAYKIDTYDADEFLTPGVIVVYNPNSGTSVQVAETAPLCLVESVRNAVTEDGDDTKSIVYYSNGSYGKRTIAADKYKFLKSTADSLKSGDIVRIATNGRGEIVGLKIDAIYDSASQKAAFVPNYLMNRRYDTAYYAGKSFSHNDSALTLLADPSTWYNADATYPVESGVVAFSIDPNVSVAVYNSKTKTVTPSTLGAVSDILSVGEENASDILIKCYFHRIQQIIIYE